MAETMQGQRKWGYQTLHWWRTDENQQMQSFWSAHMKPSLRTSIHLHANSISTVCCLYGIVSIEKLFDKLVQRWSLFPGEVCVIAPGEIHRLGNGSDHSPCGFSELYTGEHIRKEPVTIRLEDWK